jgi:Predicted acetyltransferase
MIKIRSIDPIEYADKIVTLWNGRALATFPLDARLLKQQASLERAPKECLGAFDSSGALIGAALVKAPREDRAASADAPRKGFLSFIVVAERYSRRGLGTSLLEAAEAWLAERQVEILAFGSDSYHFFPGPPIDSSAASSALDAFLESKGFASLPGPVEEDLIADLAELDFPSLAERAPLAAGYSFGLYEKKRRRELESFFGSSFPGRWKDDTFEALAAGMRDKDLAILREDSSGAIVGFSRIYDWESPILGPGIYWRAILGPQAGALGPIGVSEPVRGKGLGLALLRLCLEELDRRGVRKMVIDWTSLGAFYAKMGFVPWKAYRMYSKRLAAKGSD